VTFDRFGAVTVFCLECEYLWDLRLRPEAHPDRRRHMARRQLTRRFSGRRLADPRRANVHVEARPRWPSSWPPSGCLSQPPTSGPAPIRCC